MVKAKKGYTAKDLKAVASPELTLAQMKKAKPFRDVFPELAASIRRGRGPNKQPTKTLVSLRLSETVVEYYRSTGDGWQTRINEDLEQVTKRRRKIG